jgi:flagellar hook-associated protein 3 FlgL
MRVTNDTLQRVFINALERAQQRLAETQLQVTTGRRVNVPSDDPLAAARISGLDATLSRLEQFQENSVIARNRLGLEEEAVASVVNNLQRVRELAVQANNAPLSDDDRASIVVELRERLDGLVALANSVDGSGRYLFGGYQEATRPFTAAAGAVVYNGDDGQRSLQVSAERFVAVNDAGSDVFQRIENGNGTFALDVDGANTGTGILGSGSVLDPAAWVPSDYTIEFVSPTDYEVRDGGGALVAAGTHASGQAIAFAGISFDLAGAPATGDRFTVAPSSSQDLFTTVGRLIETLDASISDPAARAISSTRVGQALNDIDGAVNHLVDVRANVGSRLRALDEEAAINDGFSLQLTETVSSLRDLDYAEALSKLSQQLLGLEAAQQTYTRIQGLSLFRYL